MHASPTPTSPAAAPRGQGRSDTLPLLALAVGAFGIGTTEFGPMGMLPTMAQGLQVSVPSAGLLVSAYALGVMIGAPIMTLLLARWSPRKALVLLMAIFTIGNILSALAPGYLSLMVARVITSLNHGAFFGIGSVVAASLVAREKQASAVAMMFTGLTVANIGGVPAATWISEAFGWRQSFAGIGALGLLAMVALWFALPKGGGGQRMDLRAEWQVLTRPAVLMGLLTTVLGSAAMFTLYTYINPALKAFAGASPAFVTAMLALTGIGFTIGNAMGGKLADWSIEKTIMGFLTLVTVSMLAFPWLAQTHFGAAACVFVWAIGAFGLVPPVQMRVMRAAVQAPGLASSVNIGAFNLGNAIGAAAGAAVLSLGGGYAAVAVAGAAFSIIALLLVAQTMRGAGRRIAPAAC